MKKTFSLSKNSVNILIAYAKENECTQSMIAETAIQLYVRFYNLPSLEEVKKLEKTPWSLET